MTVTTKTFVGVLLAAASTSAAGDTLIGRWQCSSLLGEAPLSIDSANLLHYDGEPLPYRRVGEQLLIEQFGQVRPHALVLRGDALQLLSPEGVEFRCQRQGAAGVARGSAPGDGGLNGLLAGMLCGSAGSYSGNASNQRNVRVSFDGRGRFSTGGDSSFSGSAGFGYGEAASEGGRYEVTAAAPGATIRVQWDNGEVDEARVHHLNGGRITEIMYGEQLLGAGLCDY